MSEQVGVAVIGNRDQTALMRLAGVEKYRIIEDGEATPERLREVLMEVAGDRSVGVIMMPEAWSREMTETITYLRDSKRTAAILIGIPPGFKTEEQNVKEYYKTYTKKLIGFNVDI